MALKALLETLEGVEDSLKAHYRKRDDDGKLILDVTSVSGFSLEDVTGLKSSLSRTKSDLQEAKNKLKALEDLEPEKFQALKDELEELKKNPPKGAGAQEWLEKEKQLTGKHAREADTLKKQVTTLRSQLETALIETVAMQEIASKKGNLKLLLPHVKSRTRLKELENGGYTTSVYDDTGTERITLKSGSTEPMSIRELVAEMADQPDFAPAFKGSESSGSGASGQPPAGSPKPTISGEGLEKLSPVEKLRRARIAASQAKQAAGASA